VLGYGNNRLSITVSGAASLDPVIQERLETLLRLWQGLSAPSQEPWHYLVAPAVVLEKILGGLADRGWRRSCGNCCRRSDGDPGPGGKAAELAGCGTAGGGKGIFIRNAGLVLLHPFLPAFMAQMGLLRPDGRWKNPAAQERGLWLSQYLVSGEEELEEPAIFLNKLLCGVPMEQPVERRWAPLPEEVREAEQLLEQVIGHWTALKGISIAGLRMNFLLREGEAAAPGRRMAVAGRTKDMGCAPGFFALGHWIYKDSLDGGAAGDGVGVGGRDHREALSAGSRPESSRWVRRMLL